MKKIFILLCFQRQEETILCRFCVSPSRQVKDREGESRLLVNELKLYRSWSKSDVFQNVVGTV